MCFELCLLFVAAAMSTCGQNMERDFETKRAQFEQLLPRQNELRRKVDQAERECRSLNRGTRLCSCAVGVAQESGGQAAGT